ncbi:MAG: T9SS type A sorting domain-containing protein [candidate division WOR-3 bacterium]
MAKVILYFLFANWAPLIEIMVDTTQLNLSTPYIVSDYQGKVWFGWKYGTIGVRYYEGGILSDSQTVMSGFLFFQGLIRDKNGLIWCLADNDIEIWTCYYNGNFWTNPMEVPGFPSCNFASFQGADSLGNYWVFWTTDWFGYFTGWSRYYNGSVWSESISVGPLPPHINDDCLLHGVTTSKNGRLWAVWTGVEACDTIFVSTYNGTNWIINFRIWGGEDPYGVSAPFFTSSFIDSSVFLSYRTYVSPHTNHILSFNSTISPPETVWTDTQFERAPLIASDDMGQIWMLLCDSIAPGRCHLYWAVWNGDSVSTPQLLDTSQVLFPASDEYIAFDPYSRRVWAGFIAHTYERRTFYATYYELEGVEEGKQESSENELVLHCSPIPASDEMVIQYQLHVSQIIRLSLFNSTGRLVAKLFDGMSQAGAHRQRFLFKGCPAGVYFLVVESDRGSMKKKIVVMKR